ncbi:MAG: 1,4-alpha-glucan branching protein GlgB [Acidimicrobiales bacterium]
MAPPLRPLSAQDRWLFNEGSHARLFDVLGAHLAPGGAHFQVWAPSAEAVAVIGDFNEWDPLAHPLHPDDSGIWHRFVDDAAHGQRYKYRVTSRGGHSVDKADPVGFFHEPPPGAASVVWRLDGYEWGDATWLAARGAGQRVDAPISIYEMHLGSWNRQGPVTYRDLAPRLADHVERCGFTHVELLPIMEHPFYGSWGYQTTGYFAPTARYGQPQDLMAFVDHLHQRGIGVILDWVPSHFPTDAHGLATFDGTHLFEHEDPRLGHHPDWRSAIFNYDRHEVRSFLLSSALFWLERYHADGLRVDAVASMLYRDYSRRAGEWIANEQGGRENLGAIRFLRQLNETVEAAHPDVATYAEESTAWPGVSRPTADGGLGFGFKWDMGWMHDTLRYLARDPVHRRWHHDELTFRSIYANSENYVLPLSHDEVVYGKGSLLAKQPGDWWQQRAGLRLLYGWQFATPGKKLLFMGAEMGQPWEWHHEHDLAWSLLGEPDFAGILAWVRRLNRLYRQEPALHVGDCEPAGFEWLIGDDRDQSVYAFLRHAPGARPVLAVCNFTPTAREGYRVGVPAGGDWEELASSDDADYGGSGVGNAALAAQAVPAHGKAWSLVLRAPPLGVSLLAPAQWPAPTASPPPSPPPRP